jgi:NADH dehydrogenase [ubiquinone] 1 alpha subcomplex assembly factor 7
MPIDFYSSFPKLLTSTPQTPQKANEGGRKLRYPLILAHEFLDALPIHAFQLEKPLVEPSSPEWRELLVANVGTDSTPEFTLVPAKKETLASRSLPMADLRYKKSQFPVGTRIEICAPAIQLIHSITSLIVNGTRSFPTPMPSLTEKAGEGGGSALIIDYGPRDGIPSRSLRGISEHKFTSPFSSPGKQDLTADVDFGCIKDTALSVPEARVSGPVGQGEWLLGMGIGLRADRMVKTASTEEAKESIRGVLKRLAGREEGEMGGVYNAIAITNRDSPSEGFGGLSYP